MDLAAITLVVVISLCQSALARFVPSFTYEQLMEMSDLVVLMEHESTTGSDATDAQGGSGQITTAKVLALLKGTAGMESLKIQHFSYPRTPNAPNHVVFPPAEVRTCAISTATRGTLFVAPTLQYLAFLKRQEDGSYVAATPQYDSALSFLPVGGQLNELWARPEEHEAGEAEGERPAIRQFVEEPDK